MSEKKYKIVVADDEIIILNNLIQRIEKIDNSYKVIGSAKNGCDTYKLIHDLKPDILITDISMPIMDGLELIQKLRDEKIHIKVVLISGYSDFEYAQNAIKLKVIDYLLKPIKQSELINILTELTKQIDEEENEEKKNILFSKIVGKDNDDLSFSLKGIKQYIINNYACQITIDDIAKEFAMNPTYLIKVFKNEIGVTPIQYLINIRINVAKELLENQTNLSMKEISNMVGYCDQHYFSRIFKKITGVSPSEYKYRKHNA